MHLYDSSRIYHYNYEVGLQVTFIDARIFTGHTYLYNISQKRARRATCNGDSSKANIELLDNACFIYSVIIIIDS